MLANVVRGTMYTHTQSRTSAMNIPHVQVTTKPHRSSNSNGPWVERRLRFKPVARTAWMSRASASGCVDRRD
eukprot:6181762-Pleurochrysis_carterae.AAC.4